MHVTAVGKQLDRLHVCSRSCARLQVQQPQLRPVLSPKRIGPPGSPYPSQPSSGPPPSPFLPHPSGGPPPSPQPIGGPPRGPQPWAPMRSVTAKRNSGAVPVYIQINKKITASTTVNVSTHELRICRMSVCCFQLCLL